MDQTFYSWLLFVFYIIAIILITVINRRKSKNLQSFSIGNRNVSAVFIGLSLAANMTSAATFVINPGLIYAYGVSGIIGYAIAAPLGIFLGLIIMTRSFRRIGDKYTALTVPQWTGDRFGDKRLTLFFSVISLLQISFLVLIIAALALVLMSTLKISLVASLLIIIIFTFGYILLGGASVHIWTNTIQASIKIVVAFILIASGFNLFNNGFPAFMEKLNAVSPHFSSFSNPDSLLFRDFFEVVVANFVLGVALVTQPHIMSKSLYLKTEKDVKKYLFTALITLVLFFSVLITGIWARLILTGPQLPPDKVIATYMMQIFPPSIRAVVMLGILASGFSALEGILIALSSIFSNDFYANALKMKKMNDEDKKNRLLKISRIFLVVLAFVTFGLAYQQIINPSLSVAIFAQNGVYGLASATFAPIIFGVFSKRVTNNMIFVASSLALMVHFGMYYGNITMYHNNPAVPATFAIIASVISVFVSMFFKKNREAK